MQYRLVIVIGLPASGKSTFVANNYPEYIVFDDFISKFFNGHCLEAIHAQKPVCVVDPRLCIPHVFVRYMAKLAHAIDDDTEFKIIYFRNDPEQCILNSQARGDESKMIETINAYSKIYQPGGLKCCFSDIVPVYSINSTLSHPL
jgi:hypothetical protein